MLLSMDFLIYMGLKKVKMTDFDIINQSFQKGKKNNAADTCKDPE